MYRHAAALLLCLCSCVTAAAQTLDAFVYTMGYGTTPDGNGNYPCQLRAFTAYSNGTLKSVSGSPYSSTICSSFNTSMAVTGTTLFISAGTQIYSYAITASTGALKQTAVIDTAGNNPDPSDNQFQGMVLDHTGSNLHVLYTDTGNEGPDYLLNYKVSSGKLSFVAATAAAGSQDYEASNEFHAPTVSSNNEYLYNTYQDGIDGAGHGFAVWQRASNGTLSIPQNFTVKGGPVGWLPTVEYYPSPYGAKADPSGHLAVLSNYEAGPPFGILGNPQIGSYTITSTGSLTTTGTATNMPFVDVGEFSDMNMSPSGKVLAIAGNSGLEVFHFNGASPVATFGWVSRHPQFLLHWDDANHLYALGFDGLTMFTVTTTSGVQNGAPSPIVNGFALAVLPKT
jgi:hypothetical protein